MLPEEWHLGVLGAHIDLLSGFAFKSSEYSECDSDPRLLRGDNVAHGTIRWDGAKRWPSDRCDGLDRYWLSSGDLIIAMDRTWISSGLKVAEVIKSDLPCLLVQRVARVRATQSSSAEYIKQNLMSSRFADYVKAVQKESAVPHISAAQIREFPIPVPPLVEREKIGAILKVWDGALKACSKLVESSIKQKKALAQQLLTGKRRLPGFSDEWKKRRIDKVCDRVQRRDDGEPHPILMISSTRGWVRQDDMYSRYMAGESAKSYVLLKRGEFAYNKGNSKTYPCGCVFPLKSFETGLVPHVYICFRFKGEIEPRFYEHYFAADMLARQLMRVINTGVRNNGLLNLRPADFLACEVPIPCLEEQAAIADVLDNATQQVELFQGMKEKLELEKRALMQQLLTGKRRVKLSPENTAPAKEHAS